MATLDTIQVNETNYDLPSYGLNAVRHTVSGNKTASGNAQAAMQWVFNDMEDKISSTYYVYGGEPMGTSTGTFKTALVIVGPKIYGGVTVNCTITSGMGQMQFTVSYEGSYYILSLTSNT